MKRKNKNIIIGSVLTLAIISGSYYFWQNNQKKSEKDAIQTISAQKKDIINTVQTSGKVVSNLDVEIKCKASGEIVSLPFDISNYVKKGQLLVKLNPIDEQRNVKQAEINLDQSRAALVKVQQDLSLARANYSSTKSQVAIDLETAKIQAADLRTKAARSRNLYLLSTQRRLAVAQVETAQIQLKELQDRANRAKNLFQQNKLLSQNEYETAVSQAKQAQIELTNAEIKLKEQDTNNKNEYDTALTSARQADAQVRTAASKLAQQNNSSIELDIKGQDIKAAQSKVETDKIALLTAQQRLKDTEVYSPINGLVTVRTAQVGQIISSGISNVSGGTSVMTLSDISKIFIDASIDESDIGKIKIGQQADITVDAFSTQKFKGKVMQIAAKGTNVSNVVTFPVKIEITSTNKTMLKPEMTSNIEIIALKKDKVLTVNLDSVTKNRNKYFVTVLEGTEQKQKEIKIGANDTESYEVLSGLTEGDKIVVESTGASGSKWGQGGNNAPGGAGVNTRNITRNVRRVTGGGGGPGGGGGGPR